MPSVQSYPHLGSPKFASPYLMKQWAKLDEYPKEFSTKLNFPASVGHLGERVLRYCRLSGDWELTPPLPMLECLGNRDGCGGHPETQVERCLRLDEFAVRDDWHKFDY